VSQVAAKLPRIGGGRGGVARKTNSLNKLVARRSKHFLSYLAFAAKMDERVGTGSNTEEDFLRQEAQIREDRKSANPNFRMQTL
jgi:hypothetical protein